MSRTVSDPAETGNRGFSAPLALRTFRQFFSLYPEVVNQSIEPIK